MLGKGAARGSFEIAFKGMGLLLIRKCDGGFDLPGTILCRMRNSARVMFQNSRFQIFSNANVVTFRIGFASENVNVEETHRDVCIKVARLRRASARQPSLSAFMVTCFQDLAHRKLACRAVARSAAESEGWWSRQDSNLRPSHCERDALPTELRPHPPCPTPVFLAERFSRRNNRLKSRPRFSSARIAKENISVQDANANWRLDYANWRGLLLPNPRSFRDQ